MTRGMYEDDVNVDLTT